MGSAAKNKGPRPVSLVPQFDGIPATLRALPRWILWKHWYHPGRGKWIKLPIDAKSPKGGAKVTDPEAWSDYETVKGMFELVGGFDGVGFVFNGDGVVGIDFDDCLGEGRHFNRPCEGYCEVSPSGAGVHLITRASTARAFKDDSLGIEIYPNGRFFTITGHALTGNDCGDVPAETQDLSGFISKNFPDKAVPRGALPTREASGDFFKQVNDAALAAMPDWVPVLFPKAHATDEGGYRVRSRDLKRDLEEDLALHPKGIVDFGLADQGDEREGKRTPIDVVMEWYSDALAGGDALQSPDAKTAALWLCERLGLPPADLGWQAPAPAGGTPAGGVAVLGETLPLDANDDGRYFATIHNVRTALTDSAFSGVRIGFDTFRDEVMVSPDGVNWRCFGDSDYTRLRMVLEAQGFCAIGRELMRDVVAMVADDDRFDSAMLWLERLEWDGHPRLERFLTTHFGAEDSLYTRSVATYLWTAMAGRVLNPGCKADMVPILIGPQGARKTSGVSALVVAPEHFVEVDLAERDAEQARKMRGRLVGEIGELRGLHSRELESIKTFITRTHETWTPKYREFSISYPRRLLFIGTTNQPEFLADETGNRRWLPIRVGLVDVERIVAERLQLWAEARDLYLAGGIAWQLAEQLGAATHGEHYIDDPWSEAIVTWLDTRIDEDSQGVVRMRREIAFTVGDVLRGALNFDASRIGMKDEWRAGRILRKLGFEKQQVRNGKNRLKVWVTPVTPLQVEGVTENV